MNERTEVARSKETEPKKDWPIAISKSRAGHVQLFIRCLYTIQHLYATNKSANQDWVRGIERLPFKPSRCWGASRVAQTTAKSQAICMRQGLCQL